MLTPCTHTCRLLLLLLLLCMHVSLPASSTTPSPLEYVDGKRRKQCSASSLGVDEVKDHRQRPYHTGNTGSRSNTAVKQCRARLVLAWVTCWEYRVLLIFLAIFSLPASLHLPSFVVVVTITLWQMKSVSLYSLLLYRQCAMPDVRRSKRHFAMYFPCQCHLPYLTFSKTPL